MPSITNDEIAGLVRRSGDAHSALLRGDMSGYLTQIHHAEDYTLMDPFGGTSRGFDTSPDRLADMSRFFKSGEGSVELVQAYASGDLAVLVMVERARAEVGDIPEQDWSLRVTLVFRREGSEWLLAHRHADPIVSSISLEQAAALARG